MHIPMEGAGIAFILLRADLSAPRQQFKVAVDGTEYLTSCALLEDIAHILSHYADLAEEGKRFDLFSTNTDPYAVSVIRRDGLLYLRMTDNFDGNILEERVGFDALKDALTRFSGEFLSRAAGRVPGEEDLQKGLKTFRDWSGPAP